MTLYRGPASGFGDTVVERILARGALGASDPAAALQEVARGARAGWRVLVVSDGIATVGSAHAPSAAAKQLRAAGVPRLDAIAAGSPSDPTALRALVVPESAGAATGIVIPVGSREEAQTQVRRLHMPSLRGVGVEVPGDPTAPWRA